MKTYKIKTIGKIKDKFVQSAICINDNGVHEKETIERIKEKYPDFIVIE